MDVYTQLGQRIREVRKGCGLSQAQLAEIANTSPEFVSRVERGKTAPSIATAHRIAMGLGVELRALFDFGGDNELDQAGSRANRIAKVVVEADDAVARILEDFVLQASRRLRVKES